MENENDSADDPGEQSKDEEKTFLKHVVVGGIGLLIGFVVERLASKGYDYAKDHWTHEEPQAVEPPDEPEQ